MDLDLVHQELADINANKEYDGYAHQKEKRLWYKFIQFVAHEGPDDLAKMAKEVLKTKDIKFHRWYE